MIQDLTCAWLNTLFHVVANGRQVAPRGQLTLEVPQHTTTLSMRRPVLLVPDRKLSYKFMAAEAYWILSGDDRVETIAPYNKNIAQFSDDGKTFFGAYGPKVIGQLDHVVNALTRDSYSRQAGLTLWRENPPATKDVPCTVAMFFSIRERRLNAHVFMRSNDVWLGLPYDAFNFSMVAHLVCARLNRPTSVRTDNSPEEIRVVPGDLYLTAASCHLYQPHWEPARALFDGSSESSKGEMRLSTQPKTPEGLFLNEWLLLDWLKKLRDAGPESTLRWWLQPDALEAGLPPTLEEKL